MSVQFFIVSRLPIKLLPRFPPRAVTSRLPIVSKPTWKTINNRCHLEPQGQPLILFMSSTVCDNVTSCLQLYTVTWHFSKPKLGTNPSSTSYIALLRLMFLLHRSILNYTIAVVDTYIPPVISRLYLTVFATLYNPAFIKKKIRFAARAPASPPISSFDRTPFLLSTTAACVLQFFHCHACVRVRVSTYVHCTRASPPLFPVLLRRVTVLNRVSTTVATCKSPSTLFAGVLW